MSEQECRQAAPIATLSEAVKNLAEWARRSEALQAETLATLRTMAAQGEQIKALMLRQDELKTHVDSSLEEIYPRLRTVEEKGIKHDAFIEQHEKQDEKDSTLSIYVKGGLTVASVLAIATFLLYLYTHSGYATRDERIEVEKIEKAQRR